MMSALIYAWITVGVFFATLAWSKRNRWGAFLFIVITWPWLIFIEGTPQMGKVKRWWQK